MAEEKQKYAQRLYDADGVHIGNIESEDDTSSAEARGSVLEAGGRSYIWDQRNGQWREAEKLKGGNVSKVEQPPEPEPEPEPEPAPQPEPAPTASTSTTK